MHFIQCFFFSLFLIQNGIRCENINTFSFVFWFSHSMPFVVRPLLDKLSWRCVFAWLYRELIHCGIFEWMECEQEKSIEKVVIGVLFALRSHWPIDMVASVVSRRLECARIVNSNAKYLSTNHIVLARECHSIFSAAPLFLSQMFDLLLSFTLKFNWIFWINFPVHFVAYTVFGISFILIWISKMKEIKWNWMLTAIWTRKHTHASERTCQESQQVHDANSIAF